MTKKRNFKATASSIFNDVLDDNPQSDALLPKDANVQIHNNEMEQEDIEVSRLHVYIRGELEDKLFDEVIRRKKDKSISNKLANKRAVVEEALERFL
jgi:hypothetical protein